MTESTSDKIADPQADQPFDVVVIGNVGIDTNVYLSGKDVDFEVEANFTENLDYVGQAGGYASRGFAQLGRKTAFIGYIGDDHNGRFIREEFAKDGIDMSGVFIDPSGTSRSVNLMYQDGRRKNFYDGKSHMTLQPDLAELETCRAILARSTLAYFNIPNWARLLLPIARECGLTIACDIQDVESLDDPYRQDFIEYADILFLSATNLENVEEALDTLLSRKLQQTIVVGMGDQGSAVGIGQGIRMFEPVEMESPVIDTNGAGDSLAVGFLNSFILADRPIQEAIDSGQIAARYKCTQKGSSSHLITPQLLATYLAQHQRR